MDCASGAGRTLSEVPPRGVGEGFRIGSGRHENYATSARRAASMGSSVPCGTKLRAVESGGRRVSRSGGLLAALSMVLLLLLVAFASRPGSGTPLTSVGDEPGRGSVGIAKSGI